MTIFLNTFRRILKSKLILFTMIIAPVLLISFIIGINSGYSSFYVGVTDNDRSELSEMLISKLEESAKIKYLTEDEIRFNLINANIEYALVIDRGFAADLIDGKNPMVKGYGINEANLFAPLKFSIDTFLSSAKNIAEEADRDEEKFYKAMGEYDKGIYDTRLNMLGENYHSMNEIMTALGFLVMSMLFLSSFSTANILKDKENKTFYRILTAPVKLKSYMLQNILCYFTISVTQVTLILLIMKFVFKFNFGTAATGLRLFFILLIFSAVCTALGIGLTGLVKTTRNASIISSLLITPMCMLGGCFWPKSIMPDFLQKAANIVPTTWILDSAELILRGNDLQSLYKEIGILILFAIVFFLMGTWKKTDVAK